MPSYDNFQFHDDPVNDESPIWSVARNISGNQSVTNVYRPVTNVHQNFNDNRQTFSDNRQSFSDSRQSFSENRQNNSRLITQHTTPLILPAIPQRQAETHSRLTETLPEKMEDNLGGAWDGGMCRHGIRYSCERRIRFGDGAANFTVTLRFRNIPDHENRFLVVRSTMSRHTRHFNRLRGCSGKSLTVTLDRYDDEIIFAMQLMLRMLHRSWTLGPPYKLSVETLLALQTVVGVFGADIMDGWMANWWPRI